MAIQLWIELGQPEERRILKACGRSDRVIIYAYGNNAQIWWKQIANKLSRAKNLTVLQLDAETVAALEALCQRTMQIQVTIQDGEIWIRDESHAVQVTIQTLQ